MTTKISGNNLQADISIDTTGNQIFNGTLKLDANFPTGTDNVALGNTALDNGSLTGSQNVAIGAGTLTDTDSGADNTAVGFEALKVVTTGTNNTAIGSGAGSTITSGSNLTLVGYNATPSAVDATNEITLGDANVTDVRIPGAGVYIDSTGLGIGTATPAVALDVVGAISATGNLTSLGIDDNATSTAITINSSEQLAIGTTSFDQDAKLVVVGSGAGGSNPSTISTNTIATFRRTGGLSHAANISIIGGSTGSSSINFGDRDDEDVGRLVYDHSNNYMQFNTDTSERMRIDSSGNVGIGTSSPAEKLHVSSGGSADIQISPGANQCQILMTNAGATDYRMRSDNSPDGLIFGTSSIDAMTIDSSGNVGIGTSNPIRRFQVDDSANSIVARIVSGQSSSWLQFAASGNGTASRIGSPDGSGQASIALMTADQERMRIDSSGILMIGTTVTSSLSGDGHKFYPYGGAGHVGDGSILGGSHVLFVNRLDNDGSLVGFYQAGSQEGNIAVSGSTVSYNGFTGTHWSRFQDNSAPTILRGTVLETLDEMCDWYNLEFDVTTTTQDEDGNDVTNTVTEKVLHILTDGQSVGDTITYNHEGTDVQATIVKEADIKHMKSKVSDTVDAKNVYGVFYAWDNEDSEGYNDFTVASVGSFVVRIKQGETIAKGDLLQSNGDGTAKVQTDDAIRSSSFAKVLSTTVIETYEDGSYLVPCSLMC